jgi:hypothetical protein
MSPPDLHNIYEGQYEAWQLNESVDDFLKRLPPRTTSLSVGPWIWVANPFPEAREASGRRAKIQEELIPRGQELLIAAKQERDYIRKANAQKTTVNHLLNQESEKLKERLSKLAEEANVLTGKVGMTATVYLHANVGSGCSFLPLASSTAYGD